MRKTSLILLIILLSSPAFAQLTRLDSLSMASVDTLEAAIVQDDKTIREIVTQTSIKKIDGSKIGRNFAVLGAPDLIKALLDASVITQAEYDALTAAQNASTV